MRCFLIRNAAGEQVGIGLERANGEIVARLPVDLDGVRVGGDISRWEDAEVATLAIEAFGFRVEWTDTSTKSRLTGNWAHDYWVYFPQADPLGMGTGYEYSDEDGNDVTG